MLTFIKFFSDIRQPSEVTQAPAVMVPPFVASYPALSMLIDRRREELAREEARQTQGILSDRRMRKADISHQLQQQGLDGSIPDDHPLVSPELDTDRFIAPPHKCLGLGPLRLWTQNLPDPNVPPPPGRRLSTLQAPELKYQVGYHLWIQEGLRAMPWLGRSMYDHRTKDSYTPFDIGNDR